MKATLFLLFFISSGLSYQVAFADEVNLDNTNQQNNSSQIDIMDTPFFKEVKNNIMKDMQESFYKNKDELMTFLKQTENYTEEEYNKLYNSYEANPPFIEKDGIFVLNSDYESKNTKYIEQNGQWVENPNYVEKPVFQTKTVVETNPTIQNKKRLGKKSININPDGFK